jgi:uncharacterized MAPEG superfamily protein
MEPVVIVIVIALLEYLAFGALVGRARGVYGVKAPVTVGHPIFERTFRVHQNSLESLIVFVPAVWIYGVYGSPVWAAGIGALYVIARALYAYSYIGDAAKRGPGAVSSMILVAILLIGGLIGAVRAYL